jgi:hypothetical protein
MKIKNGKVSGKYIFLSIDVDSLDIRSCNITRLYLNKVSASIDTPESDLTFDDVTISELDLTFDDILKFSDKAQLILDFIEGCKFTSVGNFYISLYDVPVLFGHFRKCGYLQDVNISDFIKNYTVL